MLDASSNKNLHSAYHRLRTAAWLEGLTLLTLLLIAVPMKHLAGHGEAVSIVGPIHGVAFLFYLWQLFQATSRGGWPAGRWLGFFICAFIPFGFLLSLRALRRIEKGI
jgi:integral membrane protein